MTNIMTLQEERKSRLNEVLHDERGMTMIELLATVVILAVIFGIGAIAIGNVIQNSREDSAVSEVKNAYDAAKLYVSTENLAAGVVDFKLKDVKDAGMFDNSMILEAQLVNVKFHILGNGSISMYAPANAVPAGSRADSAMIGTADTAAGAATHTEIKDMQRGDLFPRP